MSKSFVAGSVAGAAVAVAGLVSVSLISAERGPMSETKVIESAAPEITSEVAATTEAAAPEATAETTAETTTPEVTAQTTAPEVTAQTTAEASSQTTEPAPATESEASAPEPQGSAQVSGAGQEGSIPLAAAPAPAATAEPAKAAEPAPEPEGSAKVSGAGQEGSLPLAEAPAPTADAPTTAPKADETGAAPSTEGATADQPKILETGTAKPMSEIKGTVGQGFENQASGVTVLTPGAAKPEPAPEPAPAVEAPPMVRFAAAFANPTAKPVLGIVLLSPDAGAIDPEALSALPFTVTLAIDPLAKGATDLAARARKTGEEVAVLANIAPEGTQPSDLEVNYQAFLQALPEAVALIGHYDAPSALTPQEAEHVAELLKADGRGLITYDHGLNADRHAAQKVGATVASIGRIFTQADVGGAGFARAMDQAAFDARQKGRGMVALPMTPEAVTALMAWAAGPSAAAVAIGPATALMAAPK